MSWLTPLGFLGLIGLIILIIIYIIKPNFQQKFVSSTFVWRLSLKYRKKKLPLNKLRNIIQFICQVLVIVGSACIIAQPFIHMDNSKSEGDVVLIIDASASMHTETGSQTRLERAANTALADANAALEQGKSVSVILASDEAQFLVRQAGQAQAALVYEAFDTLTAEPESLFTYGTPDVEGAIKLSEEITSYAKNAAVKLYTDVSYINTGDVTVCNISDTSEWNAAILDVRASVIENYYRIEIDVASYGADARLEVNCEIFNVNDTGVSMEIEKEVYCSNDQITTLVLAYIYEGMPEMEAELIDEEIAVFAYEQIYVTVSAQDSLSYDNRFCLYGGKKPVLKIQYYSEMSNNYWPSSLLVLQDILKDRWDVQITEVTEGEPATEGFDIYIFEHEAPSTVPSDGVVIYSNPAQLPADAGIRLGDYVTSSEEMFLELGETHAVMKNLDAGRISVTRFRTVISSDGYIPLTSVLDYPLILLKEDVDQKVLLMPFSLHYSNLAMVPDFPLLLKNVIDYFFPVTLAGNVFEANETVSLNARADVLDLQGPDTALSIDAFPAEIRLKVPGTYTMTQIPMSGNTVIENIFVKIPNEESNINRTEGVLINPYFYEETDSIDIDLLFYFALAVVMLLFLEWWLKSREQI